MSRNEDERTSVPDPEVVPVAKRRQFTTEEKLCMLKEADGCTEPGEIGALVRREGIYSSYLRRWRRARDEGQLTALNPQQRGRKPATDAPREEMFEYLLAETDSGPSQQRPRDKRE